MTLPFKSNDYEWEEIEVVDETGNYSLTIPKKPFSYSDMQWFRQHQDVFVDESRVDEAAMLMAERLLRTRFNISDEVSIEDLFRYPDGTPFSVYFIGELNKVFDKQIQEFNSLMQNDEKGNRSSLQPKKNSKRRTNGIQKNG